MFEHQTDPDRQLFDPARHLEYGLTGLGLLAAICALALMMWALTGGIAAVATLEEREAPTPITIKTIVHVPQPDPLLIPQDPQDPVRYGSGR